MAVNSRCCLHDDAATAAFAVAIVVVFTDSETTALNKMDQLYWFLDAIVLITVLR